MDCVYQIINCERFLFLDAANRNNENFNLISLSTNARELEEGMTYQLAEQEQGNVSGGIFISSSTTYTDILNTGQLTITRLDLNEQIISGTFYYNIIDNKGDLRSVTNGRFDVTFTQ